jgi:hypothetical protein
MHGKFGKLAGWLAGALSTTLAPMAASAQGYVSGPPQQAPYEQGSHQHVQEVSGEIMSLRLVPVPGGQEADVVAVVRASDGHRQIVDLGPESQVRQLNPQVGQPIEVRGHELPILVGHQERTPTATVTVQRRFRAFGNQAG